MPTLTMDLKVPAYIHREGDVYVSECRLLDIVSQGDNAEEAKKNLIEAITIFLFTCFEMGTFEQVLKKCGMTPRHNCETVTDNGSEQVNICLPFVAAQKLRECRA